MLQKRLDYGFNGYQVPFIPRAARSSRRRGPIQNKAEDNQLCAFDLLASVAGKILLEGDTVLMENDSRNVQDVVMEDVDEGNPSPVVEHCDQGSVETASPSLTLELGIPGLHNSCSVKDVSGPQFDAPSAPASVITASDCLKKGGSLDEIDLNDDKGGFFDRGEEPERLAVGCFDPCLPSAIAATERPKGDIVFGSGHDSHSSEGPEIFDGKPPALVSSDSSVKLTLGNDQYPCSSQSPCRDNNIVKVGSRDDDENSSECTQPSTMKTTRLPARIGDRRIRKLLASKYWRVASKSRDGDFSDSEVRCLYRNRRMGYKRQRSQRIYPFKKRRFYHYNSMSSSHADIGYKGVYNYADKANDMNASGFGPVGHAVNGSSACVAGQGAAFPTRESHVKLKIKSFRVPELFIEMPETATVGSLKRTVMEAVTALLGGGLRVGVLLQGKKIRDDNRSLVQSGICHDKVETLGFSLEPNPSQVLAPVCSEDNSLVLSADAPQPVSRCPTTNGVHEASQLALEHLTGNLGNFIESDHDSAPSPANLSAEKGTVDSRALVSLPDGTPQALSVVSPHQKSKRSDMGQRRIRRPFSVGEVEALVQAVEKLGTGRWRDVKLRAFDNVKHRTYVDLKDKWKTLVHTARISPQQRRGEPVPQELLDRVLAAHAYWSQQQARQQLKQPSEACLLL